jgi:hypothetical protein
MAVRMSILITQDHYNNLLQPSDDPKSAELLWVGFV